MIRRIWKSISSVYLLYELNTCIYMLDPWEKRFVNAFIFAVLGLLIFSSYTFLPDYTRRLVYAFLPAHSMSELDRDHPRSMEFNIRAT
ncbi:serine palmitoyltransferase small subunit A-like [Anopheles darlingi]|uniref:Putative serine palmitoyltransferase small subunit a n=2 Tax=Nyssorhynchus TaxID=44543 RepID=A0A2M4CUD3_ANODA|nr:serine palmitoyltransferase small subunit A-like [Anopheles darlingi]